MLFREQIKNNNGVWIDETSILTNDEPCEERSSETCHVHVLRSVDRSARQVRQKLDKIAVIAHPAVTSVN